MHYQCRETCPAGSAASKLQSSSCLDCPNLDNLTYAVHMGSAAAAQLLDNSHSLDAPPPPGCNPGQSSGSMIQGQTACMACSYSSGQDGSPPYWAHSLEQQRHRVFTRTCCTFTTQILASDGKTLQQRAEMCRCRCATPPISCCWHSNQLEKQGWLPTYYMTGGLPQRAAAGTLSAPLCTTCSAAATEALLSRLVS